MTAIAKIVIPPMERSLPTSVAYRSDRITSFQTEFNADPNLNALLPDVAFKALLAAVRREQMADLDAQEAALRAKYDMPKPLAPGEREAAIAKAREAQGLVPTPGFTTADKIPPGRVESRDEPSVTAMRHTPPPSAMRDVLDGTADELRRLGQAIIAAGGSMDEGMPATEAQAQALIPRLRGRLYDLEHPKVVIQNPPATTAQASVSVKVPPIADAPKAAPALKRPDGSTFPLGSSLPAIQRSCSDASHPARQPRPVSSREWDASQVAVGRPLCDVHLQAQRKVRA